MKFPWKGGSWYIDGYLAKTLNSLVYNVTSDWDFVLLITGDRGVRVGKSVLAMTVCAYLAYKLEKLNPNAYSLDNIFFDNKEMVKKAQTLPKYSIIHYDEGREGLAASKAMKAFQQDLLDFFAECGQLNHIFVIVCPDFFELKENISVARSECLINVYRKEKLIEENGQPIVKFSRGQFEFFNKKKKQILFDIAKSRRQKNYNLIKCNFIGSFTNQYCVDKEIYLKKKEDSLKRFAERHKEQESQSKDINFKKAFGIYYKKMGYKTPEVFELMEKITNEVYGEKPYVKRSIDRIFKEYKDIATEAKFKDSFGDNATNILNKHPLKGGIVI